MPYDPETFENLCPYPIRLKIEEEIKGKILNGELKVPPDQTFDPEGDVLQINGCEVEGKMERWFDAWVFDPEIIDDCP